MLVPLKSHMWLRFTDDIDIQWRHGRKYLHELLHKANTFHKTIEFTSEISNDNYVFLDTKYHIEGSQLVKDLYSKPTDSHQYLLQTSCHPRHCCKNIHIVLLTMKDAHTSCFLISVAVATKATMWTRHLPKQAAYKDMNSQNTNQTQSITPFVVTYHTNLPKMQDIIDKHGQIIETNTKFNCIFPEKPMISFRGPKSLKDILVRVLWSNPDTTFPKGSQCRAIHHAAKHTD